MRIRFWGVRGSIPTPLPHDELDHKLTLALMGADGEVPSDDAGIRNLVERLDPLLSGTVGGNTPCVELETGSEDHGGRIIFDCGSGLRSLGIRIMEQVAAQEPGIQLPLDLHILMSHTHWDHVQGFPFFRPAYVPGTRITIYSPFEDIEARFRYQQDPPHFPVSLDSMPAQIQFQTLPLEEAFQLAGTTIRAFELSHPGRAFGYRVEQDGKVFVYASDSEYKNISSRFVEYGHNAYSGADLFVFDSQFTFQEALDKLDWGHCSSFIGVDLALREEVKRLALFHFDPGYSDEKILRMLRDTEHYMRKIAPEASLQVLVAREGLEVEL